MNILKLALSTFLLVTVQNTVFAQANMPASDASTAALIEVCKNANDQDAQNFCFGFGEGVYQAFLVNAPAKAKAICFVPASNSREMILQDFLDWTRAHPQFAQERAAKTLMRYFTQRYPCKS